MTVATFGLGAYLGQAGAGDAPHLSTRASHCPNTEVDVHLLVEVK